MAGSVQSGSDGPVLVSACLLGLATRWDGDSRPSQRVLDMVRGRCVIPVCPEQLGGLSTPRQPAEIDGGGGRDVLDGAARVVAQGGRDVTENHLRGARQALKLAELFGASEAILKEGSPACGASRIQLGGEDAEGMGVTAALLRRKGIRIDGID